MNKKDAFSTYLQTGSGKWHTRALTDKSMQGDRDESVTNVTLAIRRRLLRYGGYLLSGLWLAGLTELIQFFMPARDCSLSDVGVDMTGFLLGTLVAMGFTVAVVKLVGRIRKKRGDKAAKNETLCADSPENRTPIRENLE